MVSGLDLDGLADGAFGLISPTRNQGFPEMCQAVRLSTLIIIHNRCRCHRRGR
jgi:hypothetical protein